MLELYAGLAETGVPVVGGDTTRAEQLVLSVTAVGRSQRVPGRAGAQPGDGLVVTGPLGAAGAAFRREAFVRPPLRLVEGKELAAHAHALLDLSDGLAVDAAHIAARSRCRLVIELERVPLADGAELDDLGFGEDYELLAAVGDATRFVARGGGGVLVDVDLRELDPAVRVRFELLEDRLDRTARPAPRRPEVEHDRDVAVQHVLLERLVGHVEHAGSVAR